MNYQAPNALINAIIQQESRGNPNALSPAGAMGLMQIMPATARQPGFGVAPLKNPWNPKENRRFGTDYFNAMLNRYNGDKELALIAYNAGVGNADKFKAAGRDYSVLPRQSETKPYVDNILSSFQNSAQQAPMQNNLYTTDPIDLAPSEFQQVAAKTLGPAPVPGGPMIPEAPGQAKSSPGWLNRNSDYLLALAAGLLQGQTVGQGLGKAFQNLGTVADRNRGQEFKEQLQKLQLQNLRLRNQATQSGLEQAVQRRNLTMDYLKAQGLDDNQAAFLASNKGALQNYIKSKLAPDAESFGKSPVLAQDAQGNIVPIQFSDRGTVKTGQLPEGLSIHKNQLKDLGTSYGVVDQAGNLVNQIQKDVEGEARQKAVGSAEGKSQADQPAAIARAKSAIVKAENAMQMAQTLSGHPGLAAATGPIDQYLPTFRENTANFETELNTLKTKNFLSAIQEMRDLSKTGGAVGSVTELEIEKLENSYRNLSLGQGEGNMKSNLTKLAADFKDAIERIRQAYKLQYGKDLSNEGEQDALQGWKIERIN